MTERYFVRLNFQVPEDSREALLLQAFNNGDASFKYDLRRRSLGALMAYLLPDVVYASGGSPQQLEEVVQDSILRLHAQIAYLQNLAPRAALPTPAYASPTATVASPPPVAAPSPALSGRERDGGFDI